jgi:hypothetical protein
MVNFIRQDGNKVIFSGDGELIYYVPEKYFDISIAYTIGEYVELMGIFPYGLFDKNGKKLKLGRFKLPSMFKCAPSSMSKESSLQLVSTKEPKAYRLLHFKNGDELVCDINVAQDYENVEKFNKLITRGNLPEDIPYNEIHEYFLENAKLNKFSYKVSTQLIGVIISELYRDPKDLSKPFRLSKSDDMLNYKAISILKIPKYTSAYTAITSENADEAIAAAMTTSGKGNSPLEKVVMG